jgi:hypothetical protein
MTPEQCAKSGNEFGEQSALFCWANLAATRKAFPAFYNQETKRCKMYATNQNFTDAVKGSRAKQIGIQSGVADIFIPLPRQGAAGLYVELKIDPAHPANQRTGKGGKAIAPKRGAASPEQTAFGRQVIADGYGWAVAEGWKAAAAIISQYLGD